MTTLRDDNGQEILIEDVPLTKQCVSFFDTKIKGDFSLNFTVPFTSENKKKLNYYTPQQVGTVLDQTWTITRNGNRLSRGQLVLNGIEDNEFELFFIAGNSEWISGLIKETADFTYDSGLDDELTAKWDSTEINNSINRTRGIIWPLVDWSYRGNRSGSNWHTTEIYASSLNSFYSDYYPCVYLHTLVKKIFRQSGYSVNGSLFQNKDFNSIVIAPGSQLVTPKKFIDERSVTARISAPMSLNGVYTKIPINTIISGRASIYSVTAYEYTADSNMTLSFKFSGVVSTSGAVNALVSIIAYKNGVPNLVTYASALCPPSSSVSLESTKAPGINVERGDVISFYANSTIGFAGSPSTLTNLQVEINTSKNPLPNNWIRVSDWVKLKAIDVVKFMFTYFGCASSYDNESKAITINTLETINEQEDWSNYIQSYGVEVQKTQSQNNLFTWKKSNQFEEYNDLEGGFGGGNLATGIKQDNVTWYEAPFAPVEQIITGRGAARGAYLLPRIDLIKTSDNGGKNFTSVSNVSGLARLNGTGFDFFVDELVKVTDYGAFNVYGVVKNATSTYVDLYTVTFDDFPITTGGIIKQSISYNNSPPRIMYAAASTVVSDISPFTSYIQVTGTTETSKTDLVYGWFMKQNVNEPIDSLSQSLAIENTLNGLSHKDTYLKKVNNILGNPLIIADMLLPESVFFKFNFDKFVYLKFKELSGRFFVKSIEEYRDAKTVCRVELFQVD